MNSQQGPLDMKSAAVYTGRHPKTLETAARRGELVGYQRHARCKWFFYIVDLDRYVRGEKPVKRRAA